MAVQRDNEEEREHRVEAVLKQLRRKTDVAPEPAATPGGDDPPTDTAPKSAPGRE